jgi:hypothetical protein
MANTLRIDDFKGNLIGGGSRANLFAVSLSAPPGLNSFFTESDSFMVKAASLPGSTITNITIPWRGRQLQVAGDKTFDPWVITVINDYGGSSGGLNTRDIFEQWMNAIASHVDGTTKDTAFQSPSQYMADMTVMQLDKRGDTIKEYKISGCWPTNVSAIDLSYDSENTIEEFTVEFQVTYWTNDNTDR